MILRTALKNKNGLTLIEIILASTIISLSMVFIASVYGNFLALSVGNTDKVQAVFLLDEGIEAVKTMRSYAWSTVASSTVGIDYYLVWSGGRWQSTTTVSTIDGKFVRKFNVQNVYRDQSTLNIVYTGGTSNSDSKLVNLDVSWNYKGATSSKQTSFYVFNVYE